MSLGTANRFNEGKLRYDLEDPHARELLVEVLTHGANKYGDRNFEKGMKWTNVLASAQRHLAEVSKGNDYDDGEGGTGLLHAAHLAANAHILLSYYLKYPQGDDRINYAVPKPRISLDIDMVLADWVGGYKKYYKIDDEKNFESWYLHFNILEQCKTDLKKDKFYSELEPLILPADLPFEPACYITARNIDKSVTEDWLYKHGFPCVPVCMVGLEESKVEIANKMKIDIHVDDVYKNFYEMNKAGIFTYLFDAAHNRRFDVGHKRLYNLKQLKDFH
jgi:5'(3')-deoxyribonucleotidase